MGGKHFGPVRHWTAVEDQLLRELYQKGDVNDLAELLGRSVKAVHSHWKVLRGARNRSPELARNADTAAEAESHNQPWTADDDQFVAETMDETIAEVAACLSRSMFAVQARRRALLSGHPMMYRTSTTQTSRNVSVTRSQSVTVTYGEVCPRCHTHHRGEC